VSSGKTSLIYILTRRRTWIGHICGQSLIRGNALQLHLYSWRTWTPHSPWEVTHCLTQCVLSQVGFIVRRHDEFTGIAQGRPRRLDKALGCGVAV